MNESHSTDFAARCRCVGRNNATQLTAASRVAACATACATALDRTGHTAVSATVRPRRVGVGLLVLLLATGIVGAEGETESTASPMLQAPEASVPDPPTIEFSGYEWRVLSAAEPRTPGPNVFDARNVVLDERGRLVLEIALREDRWTAAHLFLRRSLGYGRYSIRIGPIATALDPHVVLGFFTWDTNPAYAHREIDIEVARWGIASAPNVNFVVQPAQDRPDRVGLARFDFSMGALLQFTWSADRVDFTVRSPVDAVAWSYPAGAFGSLGVPPAGRERIGLNLWIFNEQPPDVPQRVVIESFEFAPLP